MSFAVGSLVQVRGREWVVLPESEGDLLVLRPLGGTDQELLFLRAFAEGDLILVDLVPSDLTRIMELVDTYRDFPLGTTDASVIAIAERLNVAEVATLDHRHFPNVQSRHSHAFIGSPR